MGKQTKIYIVFLPLVLHMYEKERLKRAHSPVFVWLLS